MWLVLIYAKTLLAFSQYYFFVTSVSFWHVCTFELSCLTLPNRKFLHLKLTIQLGVDFFPFSFQWFWMQLTWINSGQQIWKDNNHLITTTISEIVHASHKDLNYLYHLVLIALDCIMRISAWRDYLLSREPCTHLGWCLNLLSSLACKEVVISGGSGSTLK